MTQNTSKEVVLSLYKTLLRECTKFPSYNFRTYAIRRAQDAFRENIHLSDKGAIAEQMKLAKSNLEILKRQVTVASMYQTHKLIIEHRP